ncbi:glycosyltransferase [Halpernia frigidisoli]|uniref:Glycosyltransferase involved in cell wall bisynthesis n=1 Tax=Halpernia frigidisoli TaxID=1125876 RepID=A0A1I3GV87_9FLAO|nr:glycosyltransferase [Halpernia frigidisoli]SFI27297.1 Glycosyltransferase involved in cell wall bisynthesis [Halpernia frigidisoli]
MENVIIVPCYNEEKRLPLEGYCNFLEKEESCKIVFVNDGSSDQTLHVLNNINTKFPAKVEVVDLPKNLGKAQAIQVATIQCLKDFPDAKKIGYLDADLATSLEEWLSISNFIEGDIVFAFGSRISKIDNNIRRKNYRHYLGRGIATAISTLLRLTVYDTQCGCKVFRRDIAENLFKESFLSKWLFDVELFFRLKNSFGAEKMKNICREIPLQKWQDVAESKVQFTYFFRLWYDLFLINKKYNNAAKKIAR